ncbi:MAG: hypothetical protein ACK5XS_08710 [Armatimonadota bacterium]|jgi:hypothetical protein|nr:hypothetical protein [Phycisphaeraceae bacterium]MCE2939617.1 hypothetical protein [Fimbriimonadaceae bacterium]MCZ8137855.1 hypothetical protein [Fimbriimonadaceae bacterium]
MESKFEKWLQKDVPRSFRWIDRLPLPDNAKCILFLIALPNKNVEELKKIVKSREFWMGE